MVVSIIVDRKRTLKMKILLNVKKRAVVGVTIIEVESINYKIYSISTIMKQQTNNSLNL